MAQVMIGDTPMEILMTGVQRDGIPVVVVKPCADGAQGSPTLSPSARRSAALTRVRARLSALFGQRTI